MKAGPWKPDDIALLVDLRAQGAAINDIAERLNRTVASVHGKLNHIRAERRPRPKAKMGRPPITPPPDDHRIAALAARDRRLALAPRDLTASLLGDPLPGYSALDRREGRA